MLRRKCEPIAPDYPDVKKLAEDMFLTLEEAEGVGLAAPQIGKDIRLFIVDCTPWAEEDPSCADYKRAFVNPEIYEFSEEKKTDVYKRQIDYGTRRTGIAVSDPLRLIAGGLETVETKGLEAWLAKYFAREDVSTIVVGKPSRMDGTPSETWRFIEPLAGRLRRAWQMCIRDRSTDSCFLRAKSTTVWEPCTTTVRTAWS